MFFLRFADDFLVHYFLIEGPKQPEKHEQIAVLSQEHLWVPNPRLELLG